MGPILANHQQNLMGIVGDCNSTRLGGIVFWSGTMRMGGWKQKQRTGDITELKYHHAG